MPKLYTKKRINFDSLTNMDLPRYEYHRTLRSAIDLSASSYSQQQSTEGIVYQWDNIAPEIALVIIQDAQKQKIDIREELIQSIGIDKYNEARLQRALQKLHSNPHYSLFVQKLALHISANKSAELSLEHLKTAGIVSLEQFDEIFTRFLFTQKKLTKSFPNFKKITEEDDYFQFVTFMANEPLYEFFLSSFTQYLAAEFNKNRLKSNQIEAPKEIDNQTLLSFFNSISYDLVLQPPEPKPLKPNILYVELLQDTLRYSVIDFSGNEISATIPFNECNFAIDEKSSEEELKNHLPHILKITSQRGHTGDIALNHTVALRDKGIAFLDSDVGTSLFLSHLPAIDLVKDEGYQFTLYEWLHQGNLERFKDFIVTGACQRYNQELNFWLAQMKAPAEINEEFRREIDAVGGLMKEITALIASLDDNIQQKDKELDEKINRLIIHLKTVKELYSATPLLKADEPFPSTAGNFEQFVKRILFNSSGDKLTQYISDFNNEDKIWKLNLLELVNGLVNDRNYVAVRDVKNKINNSFLTDGKGFVLSPLLVFREQLKKQVTAYLKNEVHNYHTLHSYQNDKLNITQAPVVFRGGHLTDSLGETTLFAKKMTRTGEYTADGHLLAGQENNLKKHEVRSGTAITLAATGVDGTRSVTDQFDVAIKFGGMKDIKILYIVRGKESFHSHPFAEILGKTKLSEIAYTHVNPQDYIMTILYDRHNEILEVIPGNLNGEIQGVSGFTKQVITAGVDFYNQKNDKSLSSKPSVKLPSPPGQEHLTTVHLPHKKPLLEILHSHKKEYPAPAVDASLTPQIYESIRITRNIHQQHKILKIETLSQGIKAIKPPEEKTALPGGTFKVTPGRLSEVREAAVAHFNMRHILTLKDFNRWSIRERKLQETYNRILQPNFMEGNIQEQLMHANIAHEEWLTDVLVPKLQTALMLHIAARLITDYQVDTEEVNELAQKLFQTILDSQESCLKLLYLGSEVSDSTSQPIVHNECVHRAHSRMEKIYPTLNKNSNEYELKFASCLIMEKNKIQKKMLNKMMSEFLDKNLDVFTKEYGLEKKTVYPLADNHDFVFLGPAASGKSTISSQYIKKEQRKNYVSLATDDYRGIYLPFTEKFEQQETDQVFIRTQDSAYLISELVEERMHAQKEKRPNVIIDGVTYKSSQKALVEKNNNSVVVCACLDDMSQVVKRCYDRARQEESGSADKGRYVNTTSLLHMHKTASLNLLIFCAPNTTIAFYNTNVPRGETPPLIATVDTHVEKTLTIHQNKGSLMYLASFFNKSRVNVGAKSDQHLFLEKMKQPEYQIDSLFSVLDYGFKIVLEGENNQPCLTITKKGNELIMDILDPEQLKNKIHDNKTEKPLLQMLLLYGHLGNLKAVQKECLMHEDIDSLVEQIIDVQVKTSERLNTGDMSF
ncbi:zeta toxin family protein [Fluoribacter dumoffii]|uniref:zeta toxin family protein n=1 Tax=Fluoribacter dumoffii TaxID=463 RepID=UPI0022439CE0|nr:zeta toxin family protein [Fluoribacter dumoffii]MCW8419278.1 zeta toxin family protein [Fluoribacter dumoffii]MCW8452847.1 zeta toxin family protein [Fluoribacter dumoffii]MCW8459903.1 zeta toxin family protein [Fluoribacter dumoffii]